MKTYKFAALVVVSVVVAVLLATALANITRVSDSALAEVASPGAGVGAGFSRPSVAGTNYLPIIFLNSATAGGAWLLAGNAGTNSLTDFLGTTDYMTLTLRVSNTIAYRIVPASDTFGFAPNIIGGAGVNSIAPGLSAATIAGGGVGSFPNTINGNGHYATIGGGLYNTVAGWEATIAGGYFNSASATGATISGGTTNLVSDAYAAIGGGNHNTAAGQRSFIGGGDSNQSLITGTYAVIGGGYFNTAGATYVTVGGGLGNSANGPDSTIGGGSSNTAGNVQVTIGGGDHNVATSDHGTIAGGGYNSAIGPFYSTIGGGYGNIANAQDTTIAGGSGNTANGFRSAIGGGNGNFVAITGTNAFIGGGTFNTASDAYSTLGGGYVNTASGYAATVPGGELNQAGGNDSFAAGCHANANNAGAFVWADNTCTDFSSTANNQFIVKATGGVGIGTNAPVAQLHVSSGGDNFFPALRLSQSNPIDYVRVRLTNDAVSPADGYSNRWDMAAISTTFLLYSGKDNQTALRLTPADPTYYMLMGNSASLSHGGTWTNASDKNLKANFAAVDNNDVLARVMQLPLTTWSYKAEPESVRHLGPMAQDFRAAFGLGADDKSITTVDESGVALAAIQGLAHENDDLKTKNASLEARVTSQQRQLEEVNARLAALEQNPPSNALPLNALAPWGIAGLLAVWMMRKKK